MNIDLSTVTNDSGVRRNFDGQGNTTRTRNQLVEQLLRSGLRNEFTRRHRIVG